MRVCTLASSSSGNSTVVFGEHTKLLIDAGINLRELETRLKQLNIEPRSVQAILLTHDHSDHIKSVGSFMRKYGSTVYVHHAIYEKALKKFGKVNAEHVLRFYKDPFVVGEFEVTPFELSHDTVCVGYSVQQGNKKMSIATDLGYVSPQIATQLYDSRLVILESNHDEKMLIKNPKYSGLLKARIMGKNGHISNNACAKVVCDLAAHNVKQVVLAHLSDENNTPELAYNTVCDYLRAAELEPGLHIKVDVAPKNQVGTLFHIK